MNDLRLAIAFVSACSRLRVSNRERAHLLREAGGLDLILQYLEGQADQAEGQGPQVLALAIRQALRHIQGQSFPHSWQALSLDDPAYPSRLLQIKSPPAILFFSGQDFDCLNQAFVLALIGSRRPSVYGIEVTRTLAGELAGREIPLVSGGARGIDALVHRTALEKNGPTVAVLANGLDRPYPPEHRRLFTEIEARGALVTEFTPGTAAQRGHFPARNRILAGLCDAVLVTEASESSGTLITAGFAGDFGRDVLAVPGSILSGRSRSCHSLIKDGAGLIETVDDIPGLPVSVSRSRLQTAIPGTTEVSGPDGLILSLLANRPRTLADLGAVTGLDRQTLAYRMALLRKDGLVDLDRGLYSVSGPAGPAVF